MKAMIKTIAVVMAVVFIVTSATSVFAGVLPENRKESKISTEESSLWSDDANDADDQAETVISDDTDSEDLPEDQEETEIPAEEEQWEEIDEADDQTEGDMNEDVERNDEEFSEEDSCDEEFSEDDSYYEEESESEEVYEPTDDDLLGDPVIVMPWTALQNKINDAKDGDTIVLDMDYNAVNGDTMLIVEGKSITLDLNGHTLDRNLTAPDADGHAIIVRSGASLDLINSSDKEAVITGGFANNGGAVNNKGTLWVKNVHFRNNHASYTNGEAIGRGGAIYNEGTLTMRDCVIGGDSYEDSCSASDGGAIFNNKAGEASLREVVIRNNVSVNHSGGGIVNYGWVYLDECDLSHNRSNSANGGAVWNSEAGEMIIFGSKIEGNTADKGCGGGICNTGTMTLRGVSEYTCAITENSANDAGGIYNDSKATLQIEGISVTNNTSVNHGGGGIVNYGTLNIDDILVTDNTAKTAGGGIWSNGTIHAEGKIEIKDNHGSDNHNNLYLKSGKVLTVTDRISQDSEIWLWGEDMPRPLTSGWKENSGISSQDKIKKTILFDTGLDSYLYDDGELNVRVSYLDRKWNGTRVTEEERMIPESPKRIPAGGGNLEDKCWYAVCDDETVSQILIVPEGNEANIILMNGRKLTTTRGFYVPAANHYKPKATANIYGQSGDGGWLEARGIEYVPGIGGNENSGHGDLNIYGGTINATGGDYGAGIGSGDENEYTCGTIKIFGGNITAQGGKDAAGIGGGNEDSGGTVYIYDGTVNATGGNHGAGIGGGDDSEYNDINIFGGTITAQGGSEGAGIGEGYDADTTGNHNINIYGGTVHATGGETHVTKGGGGAGIGGGTGCNSGCKIFINGGTVYASGGSCGAGIGSGGFSPWDGGGDFTGYVIIQKGDVHAYATNGKKTSSSDRYYYYEGGAAIGAGVYGDFDAKASVIINDGNVEAVASCGGAAIGAGTRELWTADGDCDGKIIINGGNVSLCLQDVIMGSEQKDIIAIIGHGFYGEENGTLELDDSLKVWFEGKDPVSQGNRVSTCHSFSSQRLHIGAR